MLNPKYAAYEASRPYFELVRGALGDLVDGEHFFDVVTDDVVYEVLYDFPGWPRVIRGRADLMSKFRGYGDNIRLHSADKLITHKADNGGVLVIEYEVHGKVLATGGESGRSRTPFRFDPEQHSDDREQRSDLMPNTIPV